MCSSLLWLPDLNEAALCLVNFIVHVWPDRSKLPINCCVEVTLWPCLKIRLNGPKMQKTVQKFTHDIGWYGGIIDRSRLRLQKLTCSSHRFHETHSPVKEIHWYNHEASHNSFQWYSHQNQHPAITMSCFMLKNPLTVFLATFLKDPVLTEFWLTKQRWSQPSRGIFRSDFCCARCTGCPGNLPTSKENRYHILLSYEIILWNLSQVQKKNTLNFRFQWNSMQFLKTLSILCYSVRSLAWGCAIGITSTPQVECDHRQWPIWHDLIKSHL